MLKEIKIGGITYRVECKELSADEGIQFGWCNYGTSVLEINNHHINPQKQEQTLIHEMTHAIFHESGLEIENEEEVVNRVSLTLHQVLKDNDFSWLRPNKETNEVFSYEEE